MHLAQGPTGGRAVEGAVGVVVDAVPQRDDVTLVVVRSRVAPRPGGGRAGLGEVRGHGELATYDVLVTLARGPDPRDHRRRPQVDDHGARLAHDHGATGVEPAPGGDGHGRGQRVHPDIVDISGQDVEGGPVRPTHRRTNLERSPTCATW